MMFEEGNRLRAIYGADKVYDFSLGNPSVPAPECVKAVSYTHLADPDVVGDLGNCGTLFSFCGRNRSSFISRNRN